MEPEHEEIKPPWPVMARERRDGYRDLCCPHCGAKHMQHGFGVRTCGMCSRSYDLASVLTLAAQRGLRR